MPQQLILNGPASVGYADYVEPPLGPTALRLESLYSGVSHGTELLLYTGRAPKFAGLWNPAFRLFDNRGIQSAVYPIALGYETVARVSQIGSEVSDWNVGDLVWLDAPHRQTHTVDTSAIEGFQRMSPGGDPRVGVFTALTRVALGAVHDARPLIGDVAAVVGAGTVGLLCVQLLKVAGVREIYAIDTLADRLDLASKFGAIAVAASDNDVARTVKAECAGCDFAIEATGRYAGLHTAIRCTRVGGRVVVVSSYGDQRDGICLGLEFHRNRITLVSSMTINDAPHDDAPRWDLARLNYEASRLLNQGRLDPVSLVSAEVPFNEAASIYCNLANSARPPIKVLIKY